MSEKTVTAPDPRLGEIETRLSEHEPCSADLCGSRVCRTARDRLYLLAELRTAREALARVGAIDPIRNVTGPAATFAAGFNDALKRIRAAVAATNPYTDPEGVALVEAIIERKAQDSDRS